MRLEVTSEARHTEHGGREERKEEIILSWNVGQYLHLDIYWHSACHDLPLLYQGWDGALAGHDLHRGAGHHHYDFPRFSEFRESGGN